MKLSLEDSHCQFAMSAGADSSVPSGESARRHDVRRLMPREDEEKETEVVPKLYKNSSVHAIGTRCYEKLLKRIEAQDEKIKILEESNATPNAEKEAAFEAYKTKVDSLETQLKTLSAEVSTVKTMLLEVPCLTCDELRSELYAKSMDWVGDIHTLGRKYNKLSSDMKFVYENSPGAINQKYKDDKKKGNNQEKESDKKLFSEVVRDPNAGADYEKKKKLRKEEDRMQDELRRLEKKKATRDAERKRDRDDGRTARSSTAKSSGEVVMEKKKKKKVHEVSSSYETDDEESSSESESVRKKKPKKETPSRTRPRR